MSGRLFVDGRVLDDAHPGVRRFWVPILRAFAERGGGGFLAHRAGVEPEPTLRAAGFEPVPLRHGPRDPRGLHEARRCVRQSAAEASLSPLLLTLDGAPRCLATLFDLAGRHHPRSAMSRLLFEVALRRTVRRADVIVCASEVAERAITSAIPRARGRTARVPAVAPAPASADPERLARLGISPPYVLAIASHRPHKRLAELAAAWRRAAPGLPIVIAGTGTKVLEGPPSVRGLGFVEERDLEALLAGAGALISASLEEGWGLSVFAALASGVPVAACREPTLVEIAGDVASWREPSDLDGLIADAALLAREPSRVADRVAEGRTRAQSFTVERAAQALERLVRSE